MALPVSGLITLGDIAAEFGGVAPHGLSEYYGVAAGVPASGLVSLSDFYGVSALADVDLANPEFTSGIAGAKGWVGIGTLAQGWSTSNVLVRTSYSVEGKIGSYAVWAIERTGLAVTAGASYTFRAYCYSTFGSGSTASVRAYDDNGGSGFWSTNVASPTGQWVTLVFTPNDSLVRLVLANQNSNETTTNHRISAVEFWQN